MPARGQVASQDNTDGTQALRRAAAILRQIGQSDSQGAKLSNITESLHLPRSTTHRILKCLSEEGLVRHDLRKRRYFVGRLAYELGLAVTPEAFGAEQWRSAVENVAHRTGSTSYLMSRSGLEAVCLMKAEGNTVVRVIPVDVGQRRYLGVGAGATALLAALDQRTADAMIGQIAPNLGAHPNMTEARIRNLVVAARETGVAVSHGNVVKDVVGIGVAIPRRDGAPFLAISIAALSTQADQRALDDWTRIIQEEIEAVAAA